MEHTYFLDKETNKIYIFDGFRDDGLITLYDLETDEEFNLDPNRVDEIESYDLIKLLLTVLKRGS